MANGLSGLAAAVMQIRAAKEQREREEKLRREQMVFDQRMQERELAMREQESQQRQRGQAINEAMNVLALGDKDAAGAMLQSRGIDLRREAPVTSDQMGPGSPSFAHLRTPEERELAKEERGFGREKEMLGLRGQQEREMFGERGRIETETRQATDPQAALTGFITRAQGGQLTEDDQAKIDALLFMTRKDEGARASLERRVVGKLTRGEPLEPFEQDFARTHIQGRKPADVEAAEGEERTRRREERVREEARADEGLKLRRGEAARAGESLELRRGEAAERVRRADEGFGIRRGEAAERGRAAVFDDLDRAERDVRTRFDRLRRNIPFGKDRQQREATLDAQEADEIRKKREEFKRRFPKFAADIDAGTTEFGAKRPALIDLFRKAFER